MSQSCFIAHLLPATSLLSDISVWSNATRLIPLSLQVGRALMAQTTPS
jgi:hypothetical protein